MSAVPGTDGVTAKHFTDAQYKGLVDATAAVAANTANIAANLVKIAANTTNIAQLSNPNLLDNPDFKIDQRGVGNGDIAPDSFARDRWKNTDGTTPSITIDKSGKVTLRGKYKQKGESGVYWRARKVTISCDDPSADIQVYIGAKAVKLPSGNGRKSVTTTAGDRSNNIYVRAWKGANDVYSFKNLKVELGSIATPYNPPHPQQELAKCQRHYEEGRIRGPLCAYVEGYSWWPLVWFKVEKYAIPKVTVSQTEVKNSDDVDITGTATSGVNRMYANHFSTLCIHTSFSNNGIGYGSLDYTATTGF